MAERRLCKTCGRDLFYAETDDEVPEFVCVNCDSIYFPSELKDLPIGSKIERVQ